MPEFKKWWKEYCWLGTPEGTLYEELAREAARAAWFAAKEADLADHVVVNARLLGKISDFRDACERLINKIDKMNADPQYQTLFFMARNHGMEYQGPNCREELENLRNVINKIKDGISD